MRDGFDNMRFKVYFRVIGPEAAIRAFDADVASAGSRVKPLRRRAVWPPSPGTDVSWQWRTDSVEALPDTVERIIAQVVRENLSLAIHVAKHKSSLEWVSLVIVAEGSESEIPGGLYFSADTISAIQALGVDLDIDFARIPQDIAS